MSKTLTAEILTRLQFTYTDVEDVGSTPDAQTFSRKKSYADGTGANQLRLLFYDQRVVTPNTTDDDLDLAGVLADRFGDTVTYTGIREAVIFNDTLTTGHKLTVGGSSSNAWSAPFNGSATAKSVIDPGGIWHVGSPVDGYTVTAGSEDKLLVAHAGGAGDITYRIFLFGVP